MMIFVKFPGLNVLASMIWAMLVRIHLTLIREILMKSLAPKKIQ